MKILFSRMLALPVTAVLLLTCLPLHAQLAASGTPGDRAVYTIGSGATLATGFGTSVAHDFATTAVADTADSFDLQVGGAVNLTAGHHLVIYGTRYLNTANGRAGLNNTILLNGSAMAHGASSTYSRDNTNNNHFVRGGTIIEVAQADSIAIQSQRTDTHTQTLNQQDGDLQLVKLDDSLSFLRLGASANVAGLMSNSSAGPATISYDVQDEVDAGFTHVSGGSEITLSEAGRYLVFANTGFRISGGNRHRQAITQRLTLNGTPVEDSSTVLYLRYAGSTDGTGGLMEFGAASLGTIIRTTAADTILEVEALRDNDVGGTNTAVALEASLTGLTILKLPGYGEYLRLSGPAQNINFAQGNPETALNLSETSPVSNASFSYDATANSSQVTVNKAGDYLFLASHFADNFDAAGNNARTIFRQGFQTTPSGGSAGKISYGNGGAFNRDDTAGGERARDSGDWAGAILPLGAGDLVETTSARFGGNPATFDANTVGLQALNIASISSAPTAPVVEINSPLSAVVNSTGNVITDESHLKTTHISDPATALIYTLDSAPDGGSLELSAAALGLGDTFTQDDVDNDRLTFNAGATATEGGFDFTVRDSSSNAVAGSFVVNVGAATALGDDAGATDEDSTVTGLDLLANDSGSSLSVTDYDATSTNGAAVTVTAAGISTYDPTGSAALQALDTGDQLDDTFTYAVTDIFNQETTATVTITVDGANDAPVGTDDAFASGERSVTSGNLLANDSDSDAADTLTVSNFDAAGNGGAVPVPGPLVFTSAQGATISISSNGDFSYDPSSSVAIQALADGATLSETFSYDVFDGTSTVATTVTVTSTGTVGTSGDLAAVAANATVNVNALANDSRYSGTIGSPTAGAELEFLADGAGNSSAAWLNTGAATVASIPNGGTALIDATHNPPPPNPLSGMAAAYDFAGIEGIEHDGFDAAPYGQSDLVNASIEFLFRPSDQVGDEVLLEIGGKTDGASICLVDNLVVWTTCDNGTQAAQAVAILPPGAVAGGEWVHIVCTIDLATDTAEIWLNGVLTDSNGAVNVNNGAAGDLADWCGTDSGGIGRRQTDVGGDLNGLGNYGTTDLGAQTDYEGEVALLRTYESLLTSAQVMANFQALVGATVGAPAAGDVTDLNGTASPIPGTTVVVLASGATVAFELDGSFTYDPNGAFDNLGVGLTAQESFTYTIDNHHNATTTVVITIDGTNTDAQLNLAADQASVTEGNDASFTITSSLALPSDVEVSLSYSGTAQDGSDFNGNAAVTLSSKGGATEFDLTFSTIADSLYEGSETLTVTIDSVTGSAVLGATPAASITIADSDSPPVLSLGTPTGNTTEGSRVDFTVTASVASSVAVTVDVAYSGTAGPEDFCDQEQITIPAGHTAATASLLVLDDAVAEGNETLTATISNPSLGSLATTETDGLIAYYDFNSDTVADTSSVLGGSASANNGSWTGTAVYKDGAFGRAVEVGDGAGSNFITASGAEYEFGTATSFTVVYWLNTEDTIPGDPAVIAGGGKNWSASGGSLGWVSAIAGDDLDANIGDGSNRGDAATIDIDHDTYWANRGEPGDHWNFVAMVIDRDTQTLTNYAADEWVTVSATSWASGVTGQDFGQDSSSPTTDSDISNVGDLTAGNLDIVMGQDGDGAGYSLPASGLDDVSIWNRALTRAELWEIYAEGRSNARSLGDIIATRTPEIELEITAIAFTAPDKIALTFNGRPGGTLALFASNDLKDWMEIDDSVTAAGLGSIHEFSDPGAPLQPLRFYRLQEVD